MEWKEIHNGYFISTSGLVKGDEITTKFGNTTKVYPLRYIKPWVSRSGYLYVDISIKGKRYRNLLHRLVAIAFIDNPEKLPQVNHINGIKTDNRVENLEWCNAKKNLNHARELGLNKSVGCYNKLSRFSENEVIDIRNSKKKSTELAEIFKVSIAVISRIKNYKSYKNV